MRVTDLTRRALRSRRYRREMKQRGFVEAGPSGGVLLSLNCGGLSNHHIVEAEIDPGGKTVWVRTEPSPWEPYVPRGTSAAFAEPATPDTKGER